MPNTYRARTNVQNHITVSCKITPSQQKFIDAINNGKYGGTVFHVYASGNNIVVRARTDCGFEYKNIVGKRGHVFDD